MIYIDLPVQLIKSGMDSGIKAVIPLRYEVARVGVDALTHQAASVALPMVGTKQVSQMIYHPFEDEAVVFVLAPHRIDVSRVDEIENLVARFHDAGWKNCKRLLEATKEVLSGKDN